MGKNRHWGFGDGTFVQMNMVKSTAYQNLTSSGKELLLLFLMKRKMVEVKRHKPGRRKRDWFCENWDNITMTYVELSSPPFQWTHPRIKRALQDLMAKGFIRLKHHGGAYKRDKSVYILAEDWKRWTISDPPVSQLPTDKVPRGYQRKKEVENKNNKRQRTQSIDIEKYSIDYVFR